MKLTDREYRVLLAECASRMADPNECLDETGCMNLARRAARLLKACGVENEADTDPSLKLP